MKIPICKKKTFQFLQGIGSLEGKIGRKKERKTGKKNIRQCSGNIG